MTPTAMSGECFDGQHVGCLLEECSCDCHSGKVEVRET